MVLIIIGILFGVAGLASFTAAGGFFPITLIAVGILCIGFGFYKKIKKGKTPSGVRKGRWKCTLNGVCVSGLPCGESQCEIKVYANDIVIKAAKNIYDIPMSRTISAVVRSHSEIAGASTGSVIAGAALFGTLGAIIASRPKSATEYILIINYIGTASEQNESIAAAFDNNKDHILDNAVNFINKNCKGGSRRASL